MRAVIQRVRRALVEVDGAEISSIGPGFLVLIGFRKGDTETRAENLAGRVANLRIFEDEAGKMNRSLLEVKGSALVVSQFTLYGDASHGRRPSFTDAEEPARARALYEYFVGQLGGLNVPTASGIFGARMMVTLENDGPVTLILDEGAEYD